MTKITVDLAERGVEVLKRIAVATLSLDDASFIAGWVHDARNALRAQGGVKVKALEWHGDNGHGAGFKYVIAAPCRTPGWRVWANLTEIGPNGMATSIGAHIVTMKAENRDDAKAAAQADYERRILSSLEASPDPVSEEMVLLRAFANSFHITVVEDSFYKDVTLHLDDPHALSIRILNDSSKSWVFKDLEERRRAALAAKGGQ